MGKKILIVGAGPGGLSAGIILASRGFQVTIVEKESRVGGRNNYIGNDEYRFDLGPTFLMMRFILDEIFESAGEKAEDYLDFHRLDPMYDLFFADGTRVRPTSDHVEMRQQIAEVFPGNEIGFDKFLKNEARRLELLYPCLQKDYSSPLAFTRSEFLKAVPYLGMTSSMYDVLKKYFDDDKLRMSFTFQSKYLGMSPWECPAGFLMIPYIEHKYGIYHVEGGLNKISQAMAEVFVKKGGTLKFNSEVESAIVENKSVKGVHLTDGSEIFADETIFNSDFAYSATSLLPSKKYSRPKIDQKKFSCSTFMLYLGLDKKYDLNHHSIYFSKDYKKYVDKIFKDYSIDSDISFYICNPSRDDKNLAPSDHSALYVLVPVPNNKSNIDWQQKRNEFRDLVISKLEDRAGLKNIEKHIRYQQIITPQDWQEKYNVYQGATFNLAHNISQMLYFRPRNRFEEFENCYLVGGGTHPGSGLPTIYESGRITANLISRKYNDKK